LCVEGVQTGDGRLMADGSISWVDPPLPLTFIEQSMHGQSGEGVLNLGTIDSIVREGAVILAEGLIDDGSELGADVVRRMEDGTAPMGHRWPLSIDPDDWAMEVIDTEPQDDEMLLVASGRGQRALDALEASLTAAAGDGDPMAPEGEVVHEEATDRFVRRYTRLRIRGVTACTIQAITSGSENLAYMELVEEPVTAAFAVAPPREFFADPLPIDDPRRVEQADGSWVVPLTITDDGHVFGNVAPPETCHIGIPGSCVTVPKDVDYDGFFNLHVVRCDDGSEVCTAPLLMGCDHAAVRGMGLEAARDHYANTSLQWADVHAQHDPVANTAWLSGALRPEITDVQLRTLRGCGWSGDWRPVEGRLQLIAVQSVGTPGFGIRRAMAAGGELVIPEGRSEVVYGEDGELEAVFAAAFPLVAAGCSCGGQMADHGATAGPHVVQVPAARFEELVASVRAIDLRTRHLAPAAAEALAASLER